MKPCTKCEKIKPLTDFYKQKLKKDGRSNTCKLCAHKAAERYRDKAKEERGELPPELEALHKQETRLDQAWLKATQAGHHVKAVKIREKYDKVQAKITDLRKEKSL